MAKDRQTILVVDDDERGRTLIKRVLEEAGYAVVTASTGQEALDHLASGGVSLVLLDIRMPGMDGNQTLELIREQSDVPVIMVTGIGKPASLNTSLRLGADDYIRKPFRTNELLARIRTKLRWMAD